MITASKIYITNNYTETIWSQDQTHVISKLRDCIKLNEEYRRHFQLTKTKLESSSTERSFNFSNIYVFGKFDSFAQRCEKIIDIYSIIDRYSRLAESKIEGLLPFYSKFNGSVITMKKRNYDFLDQRRQEVDRDLDEFRRSVAEIHQNLNAYLDKYFDSIKNTERALATLKRFEKLQLPNIGLDEKYAKVLQQYSKELESVAKIYQKNSKEPPIPRDLPLIAGMKLLFFILLLNIQYVIFKAELFGLDNYISVLKTLWIYLWRTIKFINILKREILLKTTINYPKFFFPMKFSIIVDGFVKLMLSQLVFMQVY